MNPLDRALQRRRQVALRAVAAACCLTIGSAGILLPPLREHRRVADRLRDELEASLDPLRKGAEAIAFRTDGLPRLEAAERELHAIAPTEPLPSGFRAQLRNRLESMGVEVQQIDVLDVYPLSTGSHDGDQPLFRVTPVTLKARMKYTDLAIVARMFANDSRPGFVTGLEAERSAQDIHNLSVTARVLYLHVATDAESDPEEN